MRIVFDKNVPIGMRSCLSGHEVCTFPEMGWHPQLENGELLTAAEAAGFDVMITADQNIKYQQNMAGRRLALIVLGSNIWPLVRDHGSEIAERVDGAKAGSYAFIEMPLPPRPRRRVT